MIQRPYDPDRDRNAVERIWREVGWIESDDQAKTLDVFLESGRTLVAELGGEAECMVNTDPGQLRYLQVDLSACCVTGVTTSRIARRQGLASSLLASSLAASAQEGAAVAALGVFDQGFYDRLGFGSAGYERWCMFDPSQLAVDITPRIPRRLTEEDWEAVHRNRLVRHRTHGALSLLPAQHTRAEMQWSENGFGLGYADGSGELTHHLWVVSGKNESGPYRVGWMAYKAKAEALELLALLRNLGDQVYWIRMHEPPGIQLQDLLRKPFRSRRVTGSSKNEHRMNASAYWQLRVLDLAGCIEQVHAPAEPVEFNLVLDDPIAGLLPESASWRGIGGEYTVRLGRESSIRHGFSQELDTLRASAAAFSRMWLGVRSPSELSWTDALSGSDELLTRLDQVLRLPAPSSDWDF